MTSKLYYIAPQVGVCKLMLERVCQTGSDVTITDPDNPMPWGDD